LNTIRYDNIVTKSLSSLNASLSLVKSKIVSEEILGRASLLLPAVLSAKVGSHVRPGTLS